MDVSVTEANLNNASFQWGCNLATHCSVFVQLCLRKAHLFSGVEGSIQSVTEAKGEGLGAGPRRAPTILNWRRIMAKQSFVLPANSVLLQVLKMIWHKQKIAKGSNFILMKLDTQSRWDAFEHLIDSMLKVFLLIAELLMSSILITFFSCSVENLSIFTTPFGLTRPWHYARALHITGYNYLFQFFIHVCRLDACQCTWR